MKFYVLVECLVDLKVLEFLLELELLFGLSVVIWYVFLN